MTSEYRAVLHILSRNCVGFGVWSGTCGAPWLCGGPVGGCEGGQTGVSSTVLPSAVAGSVCGFKSGSCFTSNSFLNCSTTFFWEGEKLPGNHTSIHSHILRKWWLQKNKLFWNTHTHFFQEIKMKRPLPISSFQCSVYIWPQRFLIIDY